MQKAGKMICKRAPSGGMMHSKETGRADDWGSIPQSPPIQWRRDTDV